jgi:hypothetical protein
VEADVLVTLVREAELQKMGATQLFNRSKDVGIESVWAPITDKWIPESMSVLVNLVELLLARLRDDKVIVVVRSITTIIIPLPCLIVNSTSSSS